MTKIPTVILNTVCVLNNNNCVPLVYVYALVHGAFPKTQP